MTQDSFCITILRSKFNGKQSRDVALIHTWLHNHADTQTATKNI